MKKPEECEQNNKQYVIELVSSSIHKAPGTFSIIDKSIYEKELGDIPENKFVKIVKEYPQELEIRLRASFGVPMIFGPKSLVFYVPSYQKESAYRTFNKFKEIYKRGILKRIFN